MESTSPSPGSHKPCKIRVVRASTSEDLGYIARDLGPFILPVYTRNKSSASKYACPIQDKPKQELRQINPPDHDHPYFAPYEANEVYKILGTTGHTAPGATKGSTGSTRSTLSRPESSVWSLSSSTNELTLTWVQDDKGTNVPLHPFSAGDGPSKGYMMAAIDRHAFQSTFPNAFELRFFAELDT
ncbi:hypothetical protein DL96DRAFT_889399 [Flagelloscypha sp. PMI_526]|nr:hypothetical protein DL96DRAFT_889399 [Flagelloscypha sp. PMI_526]